MHNLKDIDVDIPLGKLTVVCGVSGSGKTSLAIDTLFAEGQRRYIESFAPKLRRFLPKPDRPEYDTLDSLPASIALTRQNRIRDEQADIGTATEIDDYLRILFSELGVLQCPGCGRPVVRYDPGSVVDWLAKQARRKAILAFAVEWQDYTELAMHLADYQLAGFVRLIVGDRQFNVDTVDRAELAKAIGSSGDGFVVVDRVMTGEASSRLLESATTAFDFGDDRLTVFVECDSLIKNRKGGDGEESLPTKGKGVADTEVVEIDGASFSRFDFSRNLECRVCATSFPLPEPRLFRSDSPHWEIAVSYRIGELSIAELRAFTVDTFKAWLQADEFIQRHREVFSESLDAMQMRLEYLQAVGLGYLAFNRRLATLSSGEMGRVGLTGILGSSLVDMLYVLDEPTVGLHPSETQSLAEVIERLRDRGNTVVLVEHEPELMRRAEYIVELGPQAGIEGGDVCFAGSFERMTKESPLTGKYFGRQDDPSPAAPRPEERGDLKLESLNRLRLVGATGRNLKDVSIEIPIGGFVVVSGVSGSGKSSLIMDTLVPAIQRAQGDTSVSPLPFKSLIGHEVLNGCECVDTAPIAQSSRSCPASFTKIFDELRRLFAATSDAKRLNWTTSHFSYNSSQGRCLRCEGDGRLVVDMQFMSDLETECPDCRGSGYRYEILEAKYRDRNIAECLAMSIDEARIFFRGQPKLQKILAKLSELGLGYLPIGQRLSTLSAGELQRLKLARRLIEADSSMLFVMDEPTTGLHFADVERLVHLIRRLTKSGNTVIVVEHNVALIEAADYVIDLGPGPGDLGGTIVAQGRPSQIAQVADSLTGRYLFRKEPVE